MVINFKKSLLAGTAIVAVGALMVPAAAHAGNSANLVIDGGGAAGVPPAAGETLEIQDNDTSAIWDADDGVGSATSDIDFVDTTNGASSVLLEDSTGAGPIIIRNIIVTDDNDTTSVEIDGTNGDVDVNVVGDINGTNGAGFSILLSDGGNSATLTLNGAAAQAVDAVIDGGGAGEGTIVVDNAAGVTFADDIGSNDALAAFNVAEDGVATTDGTLEALAVSLGADSSLTANDDVTGDIDLAAGAGLTVGDGVTVTGVIDNLTGTHGRGTVEFEDVGGGSTVTGEVGGTHRLLAVNITGAGGTVTFDDNVSATTITVSNTGTADFDGDVTGNVNLSAAGAVELADGSTLTGALNNTSGGDGVGTLSSEAGAGTTTITGAVGATNSLAEITIDGAGTTAFGSTVNADDVTFNDTGTVTFAGNVTTANGIDFNDEAGTASFAHNANLTGDIIDSGDGEGTVNFAGSSTVVGNLGITGANDLGTVNFNGGAGRTVTVSEEIAALAINVDGVGTVVANGDVTGALDFGANGTFRLYAGGTITGAIDNDTGANGVGHLVFLGDGTASSTIGTGGVNALNSITLLGSGTTVTAGGNVMAATTNNLNGNTLDITGTFGTIATQTINTSITSPTVIGQVISSAAATIHAGTLVDVNVATGGFIADGTEFTVVDGTGGGGVSDLTAGNITDNSFLLDFTQDVAENDDLVLVTSRTSSANVAVGANNQKVGQVLEDLGAGGDNTLDQIQGALNGATTAEEVDDILSSLNPNVDGGAAVVAGFQASVQTIDVTTTRLAALRNGETGAVAGNMGQGVTMWLQGFGQTADQDRRDGVAGYDSDTYGMAVGIDTENMADNATVGIALSYANTDVDSKNVNTTESDVDSYQVSLYGDFDIAPETYLAGTLAYAHNNIDQARHNVGIAGNTAVADYDSNQYIAYAELGRDYQVGDVTTITPSLLAHYQHINIDDYTETWSAGGGMNVDNDDLNILEFGVGAEASWNLDGGNGSIVRPALNAGYRYDVIGDEVAATSRFTGGGASFNTNGMEPSQHTFNIGASLGYALSSNWEFVADYDYEVKSDYDAHSGFIRAGYKF